MAALLVEETHCCELISGHRAQNPAYGMWCLEFEFDPEACPAATQSVFVVSSSDFPDDESWAAFCDANHRADVTLAALNRTAANFLLALQNLLANEKTARLSADVGGTTELVTAPS